MMIGRPDSRWILCSPSVNHGPPERRAAGVAVDGDEVEVLEQVERALVADRLVRRLAPAVVGAPEAVAARCRDREPRRRDQMVGIGRAQPRRDGSDPLRQQPLVHEALDVLVRVMANDSVEQRVVKRRRSARLAQVRAERVAGAQRVRRASSRAGRPTTASAGSRARPDLPRCALSNMPISLPANHICRLGSSRRGLTWRSAMSSRSAQERRVERVADHVARRAAAQDLAAAVLQRPVAPARRDVEDDHVRRAHDIRAGSCTSRRRRRRSR